VPHTLPTDPYKLLGRVVDHCWFRQASRINGTVAARLCVGDTQTNASDDWHVLQWDYCTRCTAFLSCNNFGAYIIRPKQCI